jgi:hypothetical protein
MQVTVKFRPSSHSEDGTIVATFANAKQAAQAAKHVQCYGGRRLDNKVKVECCNGEYGTLQHAEDILRGYAPLKIEDLDDYQDLTIEVTLPRGITEEAAPLIINDNTLRIIRGLRRRCGKPQIIDGKKTRKMVFHYVGEDTIYYKSSYETAHQKFGEFWLDETIPSNNMFRVRGLV